MTVQPIRLFGDPILRTRATEVVDFDAELRHLVKDLWQTMENRGGAGLAAPQIGVGLRVFTYHCDGFSGHLINPTFDIIGAEEQDGPEACLSIPGVRLNCRRHLHVVANGWNQHGEPVQVEGSNLLARCIQHETDHLDGVLFLDRLDARTKKEALKAIRESQWFAEGNVAPVMKQNPHPLWGDR